MTDLYPTKTRLALLDDIANGQVLTDITADDDVILLFPWAPIQWQDRVTVTARVRELEGAGWVETDEAGVEWQLTELGRAVRAAARPNSAAAAAGMSYATEPCRSCSARVIWAETENGRSMPVDAEPAAKGGNIALISRGDQRPLARVLNATQQFGRADLRTSHFATCPQADKWRTGGKRRTP